MKTIITLIKEAVWGAPTIILLVIFGVYFTLKTRFFLPSAVRKTAKDTVGSLLKPKGKGGVSPLAAVATALGGTVGIGSIVGVGYGISVGGAGSIFWMWVCSFFGMGLKYAEVAVALNKRKTVDGGYVGGASVRLRGIGYKKLACIFALFCVTASFGTGNIAQVGALTDFLTDEGLPRIICAFGCLFATAIVVFGGKKRIASVNVFAVPIASIAYIAVCFAVLVMNIQKIPSVFSEILKNAFGFSAVTGGFSGALLSMALREGFVRSMFSNEAGMGSSPLAHASSSESDPYVQAEWGIFEIFFDTFVVSTLTALCLILCGAYSPFVLFETLFGRLGKWLFLVVASVFAFSSIISWCFYAECSLDYLFPNKKQAKIAYRTVFSIIAFAGAYISGKVLWDIADILNAFMMFPNLFLLYKCRKEIGRVV